MDRPERDKQREESIVSAVLDDGRLVELVCVDQETLLAVSGTEGLTVVDHVDGPDGTRLVPVPARNNLIKLSTPT